MAGVVASAVIAVLALLIQQNLAEQERQRAAVTRSVALYQDFVGTKAVKDLKVLEYKIEQKIYKRLLEDPSRDSEDEVVSIFGEKEFFDKNKREHIYESVVGLLKSVYLIYECGNFAEIFEERKEDQGDVLLCDRNTFSTLLGNKVVDFFFGFRPVFYCDSFIKKRYFYEESLFSYVGKLESLSMYFLKNDINKYYDDFKIFRAKVERPEDRTKTDFLDDIKKKRLDEEGGKYALMRLTKKRCESYPS